MFDENSCLLLKRHNPHNLSFADKNSASKERLQRMVNPLWENWKKLYGKLNYKSNSTKGFIQGFENKCLGKSPVL